MIAGTTKTKGDICPLCGSSELIHDYERGEIVCAACGTVIVENLADLGPEWRDVRRARAGPPLRFASTLTTEVDNRDVKGRFASIRVKLHYFENRFNKVMRELERLKIMGVPESCIEQAMELYRRAYERGLTRGKSVEAVAAAVLYAACRALKTPRTAAEIARYTKPSKHEILRVYAAIAAGLGTPKPDVADYVRIIAARLKLSAETTNKAIEMARGMKGAAPHVAAAVAAYLASGRAMKEAAEAAGISTATLRTHLRKIGVENSSPSNRYIAIRRGLQMHHMPNLQRQTQSAVEVLKLGTVSRPPTNGRVRP